MHENNKQSYKHNLFGNAKKHAAFLPLFDLCSFAFCRRELSKFVGQKCKLHDYGYYFHVVFASFFRDFEFRFRRVELFRSKNFFVFEKPF